MKQIIDNIEWNAKKIMEELNMEIEIQWVKAHNEENGNEMADYMAGRGMRACEKDNKYKGYQNWIYISRWQTISPFECALQLDLCKAVYVYCFGS